MAAHTPSYQISLQLGRFILACILLRFLSLFPRQRRFLIRCRHQF